MRDTQAHASLAQRKAVAGGRGRWHAGLVCIAWGGRASFPEEVTLTSGWGGGLCPEVMVGKALQALGTTRSNAQRLGSIWAVQGRAPGSEWLEDGVCV